MSLYCRKASVVRGYVCVYVRMCVQIFKNFSSETTGPIEAKFHVEPPWDGGTKIYSNGSGHVTNMAAMPIYSKNLKKSFSPEPKKTDDLETW